MASPQKENGYTPIAHEVMRALIKQDFSAIRWRVMMTILMDSWGQSRKETELSCRAISNMTGIAVKRVQESIRDLESRKIVTVPAPPENRHSIKIVRIFQKDYDQWAPPQKRAVPEIRDSSLPENRGRSRTRVRNQNKEKSKTVFVKPTLQQCKEYALEKGYAFEVEGFYDHFETRNWRPKGYSQQMTDWRAAMRNWARSPYNKTGESPRSDVPRHMR